MRVTNGQPDCRTTILNRIKSLTYGYGEIYVASRRRGGADIDDLKARLGLKEEEVAEEAPAESQDSASSAVAGGEPEKLSRASGGAAEPGAVPHEDYTTAVHDDIAPKYEPVESDFDGSSGEIQQSLVGVIIVGVVALLVGLVIGFLTSSVSDKNQLYNAKVREAASLFEDLRPVSDNLTALKGDLQGMSVDGYTEGFGERLRQLYKLQNEDAYSLSPLDLANSSAVLTVDEEMTQRLINFAVNSQTLKAQVDQHLAATARDQGDLEKEAAGEEESVNYAIIFDSTEQGKRWENYNESPAENVYQPIGGLKVTYDSLDVETIGEGDSARFVYTVRLPGGNEQKVPIYEVLPVAREQLVQRTTSETATSRYMGRVNQIREAVETLATQGKQLAERLEEEADKSERFAF